jgi:hypothetical protein
MRLTLRTLLAYLDDVLDPADKEELAKKIESSEFAEDLVHKTRDTVRRLRLSAPQVIGTGMGLDPNSVAEYLDNVMPPNEVGEFERICLDSDLHLAEVAACHHVLTMILGQPADVDPLARQRMYTIAAEAAERKRLGTEPSQVTSAAAVTASHPVSIPSAAPQARGFEIPEYLRTRKWWQSWAVLAGLAAILIVGIAIVLATRGRSNEGTSAAASPEKAAPTESDLSNATAGADQAAAPAVNDESVPSTATNASAPEPAHPNSQPVMQNALPSADSQPATKSDLRDHDTAASAPGGPVSSTTPTTPSTTPSPPATSATAVVTESQAASGKANTGTNPTGVAPANQLVQGKATANIPQAIAGPPAASAATKLPLPVQPGTNPPTAPVTSANTPNPATVAANELPPAPAPFDTNENPANVPQVAKGPVEIGSYVGASTVLLKSDGKTGAWFRVEPRAAIVAGEKLLSLPEFRPKIALLSGVHLDLTGGTRIAVNNGLDATLQSPDAKTGDSPAKPASAEIPNIDVLYGRIVLTNGPANETRVRLKLGPNTGEAQLGRNATLAIEVEPKYVPGHDPRQSPAPIECRLIAPFGGVVWKDSAGTKSMDKPSRLVVSVAGATDPVADSSPPDWVEHEPIVQLSEQRDGAPMIEKALVSNAPVDTQLLELYQVAKQKRYVKSLIARSGMHLGLFVPVVDALRDPEQRSNWKTHIDSLRVAMATSADLANKAWQTLVDQRGRPAATDLYEMLCGYTPEQIGRTPEQMKAGVVVPTLIDRLQNESLDYRVLAWHDLFEITGKRLMSNPAGNLSERTQSIRAWRARLESGDLKMVSSPQ